MRKVLLLTYFLLSVALAVSGCDFFRRLAGRPTSKDIETKREVIRFAEEKKAEEARLEEARKDSLRLADSLAALGTVQKGVSGQDKAAVQVDEGKNVNDGKVNDRKMKDGKKRFYIVMASFSSPENARKYLARMEEKGYPGELLGFKGDYTGVGICGTDDEQEAKESLKEIKRQDFCPSGVWIIDRNKR